MSDQSPFFRKSTPSVISRVFAMVFSRMSFRIRGPVLQVSLPEFYDKTSEINGFTVLQLLLKDSTYKKTLRKGKKAQRCHRQVPLTLELQKINVQTFVGRPCQIPSLPQQ
jgi:hypothetical protein